MHRTQIQLPPAVMEELRGIARQQHVSVAELIRRGIDLLLRSRATVSGAEMRRRALSAVGRFRSGKRNLSVDHDREFARASGH